MQLDTNMRNGQLNDLVDMLRRQRDVRYDVVAPGAHLRYQQGQLVIDDGGALVTDDGVDMVPVTLVPTELFDSGISERLKIPRDYLRKMRTEAVELLDENVNTWLSKEPARLHLVRGFRVDDPAEPGLARAFLSDHYKAIDNLDVLMAALDAMSKTDREVHVVGADLTERAMRVRVQSPSIHALAPRLLDGYRSPFDGTPGPHGGTGGQRPIVFAGFELSNSETGGGAFQIVPRLVVQICRNGLTMTRDAVRHIHLGGTLEAGVVRWSEDTQRRNLELVQAQAADAVRTFMDTAYVEAKIAELEAKAGRAVEQPIAAVEIVSKRFGYTQAEQETILNCFVKSAQLTNGGIMQAITAAAQELDDGDRAAYLEGTAVAALEVATP